MKWQCALLLSTILAGRVTAQEQPVTTAEVPTPPPGAVLPPVPQPSAGPGSWDGPAFPITGLDTPQRADRLAGNHNYSNFINWVSNPLSNIDPRAVTAVYPLFGSEWVSNTSPIPNLNAQVYGPAISVALSERFAFGINQGGYVVANTTRNPLQLAQLRSLDPLGRFRDAEDNGRGKRELVSSTSAGSSSTR